MRIRIFVTRYSPRRRTHNTRIMDLPELVFWAAALVGVTAILWVASSWQG